MDIKKILFRTNEFDVEKALPDAVVFCNKEGKIQWVNDKAAEYFETSKMHLLTSNIADFVENALPLISSSLLTENSIITKFINKEIYFDMTSKEIDDGYVLAFRDTITERSLIDDLNKEEEEFVNRNKNNFILKLANDLKSPLQSIVGFAQAMSDGLGGDMSEQQEKYIRIIKKNSSDLMYFITKLLELTQTEFEVKNPELRTFDIISTVNSLVRFNEQLHKDKDIRWNIEIEEDFKKAIVSDEELVKTILQNILEVILKSVDMGEISLSLKVPTNEYIESKNLPLGEYVLFSVSSNSLLLSENDLESMFDPYKIIDTTNRKNLLRAITLACVKNIVQQLQGVVWVESKILKNTSFNVIIPSNN